MGSGLRAAARSVLEANWRSPGFTCPNGATYPWLWHWDSCFHSIVWAELGEPERALSELTLALSAQNGDGFVPHLLYLDGSHAHDEFWGSSGTSSITQPPIHGLSVVELARRGVQVPTELIDRSVAGFRFLFERRRRSPAGLIEIVHPWESGCDSSPRWDDLIGDTYDEQLWFRRKGELLRSVLRSSAGSPVANDAFPVGSVAFSAMTSYCAAELADLIDDRSLREAAAELAAAIEGRWDPGRRTFVDDGPTATGSGRVRTAEALLGSLVVREQSILADVSAELADRSAFGGDFGPTQVHRDEPTYLPHSYWRGPSWPQLDHLLCRALDGAAARDLAAATVRGAQQSGWAEYWDADDGSPGGAAPQSWTTLAVLMEGSLEY